jgi:triphosphatase
MSAASPAGPPRSLEFEVSDVRLAERWIGMRPPAASPALLREGPARTSHESWLDTARSSLLRAGISLVVRRRGRVFEAELRSCDFAAGHVGPFVEPLRDGGPAAVRAARGPVGSRVVLVAGRAALRELMRWDVRETSFAVRFDGGATGALVLRDVAVPIEGERRRLRIQRLCITAPPDVDAPRLSALTDELTAALGLREARQSVFEAGLAARGIELPRPADLGPSAIAAGSTLGEAALATLRREFAVFLDREPGTRLGDDPEDLHQMRVASRRMRAAIRLFHGALPREVVALGEDLADIAAALGEVRDIDVQNERIAAWAAQDRRLAAAALAPAHREDARRRMLAVLDSPRYRQFRRKFGAALRRVPTRRSRAAATPVVAAAPDLVRRRRRKVKRAAKRLTPASPPAAYHELRILCKRLRYALEFLQPVYGEPAARLAERIADVQNLLGRHQDACVAMALLEGVLDRAEQLPARTAFAMGVAVERSRQEAARLRDRVPRVYERTTGKPWQRLERAMDELARDRAAAGGLRRRRPPRRATRPSPA